MTEQTPDTSGHDNEIDAAAFLAQCRPKLEQLESIRLKKLKLFQYRKKMAVPIGAVLTPVLGFIDYGLLLQQRSHDEGAAGITIVGLLALWHWVTKPKRDYARAYKTEILPEIAGLFGDFRYNAKGKIDMAKMKSSKIMPYHTGYKSEDYFEGTYKNVDIQFSEIHLTKKSDKTMVTVFKGLAILLTQGTRKFYGHTILTKDQGSMGEWFKSKSSQLKRANLVDPEFEKLFDVFTSDQVEARYLIDPLIIENLKALYAEYNGNAMSAAFYDGHVLILIGSKDNHFEPASIEIPATNEAGLLSMKREITQILSIIDRLSLYDPRQLRRSNDSRQNS